MFWLTLLLFLSSAIDGPQQPVAPPVLQEQPAAPAGSFSGNYYGYSGRTLNTWEFHPDGTFLHTWIVSGAGTSVRNSERGEFRITGDTMELRTTSAASAFVTPGSGGRTTLAGGGAGAASEVRRLKFQRQNAGIILDGQALKPKSW